MTEHVAQQAGRDVRPSRWERTTRDRLIAGDDGALNEIYDPELASFVVVAARGRGVAKLGDGGHMQRVVDAAVPRPELTG